MAAAVGTKRPISTWYYQSPNTKIEYWSKQGHSASLGGAIRAAVTKIMEYGYSRADIYDQFGTMTHRISMSDAGTITIRRT